MKLLYFQEDYNFSFPFFNFFRHLKRIVLPYNIIPFDFKILII
jgi:hypothetical protein